MGRFPHAQILAALREADGGAIVGEICQELRLTDAAVYQWREPRAVLNVGELRELRALREESRKH